MTYFRSIGKLSFMAQNPKQDHFEVLLTQPVNLKYELYCLKLYEQLVQFLQKSLEKSQSLE